MSFFIRMGVVITDLECFRRSCERNRVDFIANTDSGMMMQGLPVEAILRDATGEGYGARDWFLVREKGAFKVVADEDTQYHALAHRIGGHDRNLLTRDYSQEVVEKGVMHSGGMVTGREELPDGSVVLRVANM